MWQRHASVRIPAMTKQTVQTAWGAAPLPPQPLCQQEKAGRTCNAAADHPGAVLGGDVCRPLHAAAVGIMGQLGCEGVTAAASAAELAALPTAAGTGIRGQAGRHTWEESRSSTRAQTAVPAACRKPRLLRAPAPAPSTAGQETQRGQHLQPGPMPAGAAACWPWRPLRQRPQTCALLRQRQGLSTPGM